MKLPTNLLWVPLFDFRRCLYLFAIIDAQTQALHGKTHAVANFIITAHKKSFLSE